MANHEEAREVLATIDHLLETDARNPADRRQLEALRERVVGRGLVDRGPKDRESERGR